MTLKLMLMLFKLMKFMAINSIQINQRVKLCQIQRHQKEHQNGLNVDGELINHFQMFQSRSLLRMLL